MPSYASGKGWTLYLGDCREVLPTLSLDAYSAVVTDPPYGVAMAGWDHEVPDEVFWRAAAEQLLPGAPLFVFGATRLFHRAAVALDEADCRVRDVLSWMYGSGFPKAKTALKPAWEPIIMARKAGKVRPLNIDGCRVGDEILPAQAAGAARGEHFKRGAMLTPERVGRWPANVCLDEEAAAMLGDAARFFYCAKPSAAERTLDADSRNTHPTVKPVALMRWLCRLATFAGECVLDPFAGSGTTLVAALLEGRECVGVELSEQYAEIIAKRCAQAES